MRTNNKELGISSTSCVLLMYVCLSFAGVISFRSSRCDRENYWGIITRAPENNHASLLQAIDEHNVCATTTMANPRARIYIDEYRTIC